ncbi:hypothetical protein ACWEN6_02360 [Sphaerisporangium sp. NPDC004334]
MPGRGTYVRGGRTVVDAEPGMRVPARPASAQELTTMALAEDVRVLVVERRGGDVEVLPAAAAEVRAPE